MTMVSLLNTSQPSDIHWSYPQQWILQDIIRLPFFSSEIYMPNVSFMLPPPKLRQIHLSYYSLTLHCSQAILFQAVDNPEAEMGFESGPNHWAPSPCRTTSLKSTTRISAGSADCFPSSYTWHYLGACNATTWEKGVRAATGHHANPDQSEVSCIAQQRQIFPRSCHTHLASLQWDAPMKASTRHASLDRRWCGWKF